jgi:hypothetical protein
MANDDLALYRAQSFGATVGIGARPTWNRNMRI